MKSHIHTETKSYQCRHIFTDGHRCGSKCLRREELCYYHHTTRRPAVDLKNRRARTAEFDLPNLEDRSAIQAAIGEVLQRIAANEIDPKRAGLLLYGLQIASCNLPREAAPSRNERTPSIEFVEEIVLDEHLGHLAPRAEFNPDKHTGVPSLASILMEALSQTPGVCLRKHIPETEEDNEADPAILPEVQATADTEPLLLDTPRFQPWVSPTRPGCGLQPLGNVSVPCGTLFTQKRTTTVRATLRPRSSTPLQSRPARSQAAAA